MDAKYIVFQDNLSGLTWIPQLGSETLKDTIQNITEGRASQSYMYFIYTQHEMKVPLFGTKFDTYKYVKAVAGSKVEPAFAPNRQGLDYALSHQSSEVWLFTDKLWEK